MINYEQRAQHFQYKSSFENYKFIHSLSPADLLKKKNCIDGSQEMNTGRIRFTLDVVNEVLAVFGGESTEAIQSMETYSEEDEKWIQKTTKFEHKDHLSIIIPCN